MSCYRFFSFTCFVIVISLLAFGVGDGRGATSNGQQQAALQQNDQEVKKTAHQRRQEAKKRLEDAIAARKAREPKWAVPGRNGKEATR